MAKRWSHHPGKRQASPNVTIERILDRLSDIRISEAHHGPPEARQFDYVPLYILRGLEALHIEFAAKS